MGDGLPFLVIFVASLGLAGLLTTETVYRLHLYRLKKRRDAAFATYKNLYRKTSSAAPFERIGALWDVAGAFILKPAIWPRTRSVRSLMLTGVIAGILLGLAFYFVLSLPWFVAVPVGFAACGLFPRIIDGEAQQRETARFIEIFPDTVDMLVRMLRAGLPLYAAVARVGKEASAPANKVFIEVAEWLDVGVSLGDAFLLVNERIQQPDFEFFGVSLSVQNMSGGNLTDTLGSLSVIIRERILSGLKARSVSAEARMSANIISSLPVVLVVGIQIVAPGYLKPLVDGSNGYSLISYALGSFALGIWMIRSMISRLLVS
jgi:tight adherence protein B